jgi:hypothetical protein
MAEELISSYIDRAAIKAETDFFLTQLKSVLDAYTNLGNTKVNLSFSDSIRSTTTNINQLNESLKQTTTISQQASKAIEVNAAAFRTESVSIDENLKLLIQNKTALDKVQDAQKLYKKQLDEGKISLDQYTNKMAEAIKRELEFKQSIADINAELKNSAKADFAAPNSINEARANVGILTKERNSTDVNDVERIAELNALIDKNNQLIDANSDKLAKQKINIGNYPTAFSGAFKFLNDELASIEGKLSGPGLSGKEVENLAQKQEVLRNATALVNKEFSSSTAQQNAFKEAATQIGVVFGKDSETFQQFNTHVKAGKAELDGVKNAMSGAEVAGNKFGKVLGGIWGGIRQIAYAIPGVGIAGLVGLLLTPLGALGAELFKYVKTSGDAGKSTEDLNEKLKSQAEIIEETKSKFSSAAANVAELKEQVLLAKQGFLDKDQVVKQYNETMGKTVGTVKNLEQVEQELVQNGEAYIQFTLLKAAAQIAYGKAAEKAFEVEETARKKANEFKNVFTDVHVVASGSTSFNAKDYEYQQQQIKIAQERRKQEEIAKEKDKEKKLLDIANDFEKQAAEISKKFHFNFFGDGKEDTKLKEFIQKFFDQELKAQQEAYTKISQSDTVYLDTRLEARKRAYEFEYQIIEGQKNYELTVEKNKLDSVINYAKASKNEKINAQREYASRVSEINEKVAFQEKDAAKKLVIDLGVIRRKQVDDDIALIKKEQEEIAAYDKKKLDAELKYEQDRIKLRQDQDAINQDTELRVLDLEYQKKLISEEEYQKKKFEIEKYYSLKSQTDTIADLEKQIQKAKEAGQSTLDLERKIADEKKKIDDELTKKLIDNRDKLVQREKDFANTIIGAVQSLIDNGYERQKNALQDQIDLVDVKKQKEVDAVNATTASEQDKAAKIAIINQRAEDQKAELQKKQREQDIKKAQFDKLIGILQVGVSTQRTIADLASKAAIAKAEAAVLAANPVTAAYAPIAFASAAAIAAQIPLALAQGAIQAGLIAAQPIPKYKTGTGNHPGGLMYAGDGGKSEIVITPDGNAFTTPSVATLYDMPRGTVVLPDSNQAIEQSFNMMYKPVLPALANGDDIQVKMLSKKMDAVINAINNIPGTKVINTWSGVEASYENVSRLWEYINRNTQSR